MSSPRRECRPLHAKTGKAKAPRRYRPVARLLKELAARSWPREARCKCEAAGQGGRRAGWSRMTLAASALLLRAEARPDELTALHPLRLRCHPSTVPCRDHGSRGHGTPAPYSARVHLRKAFKNLLRSRASTFKSGGAFYSPRAPKESEKSPIPNKKKERGRRPPFALPLPPRSSTHSNQTPAPARGRGGGPLGYTGRRPDRRGVSPCPRHAEQDGDPGLLVGVARLKCALPYS